VTDDRATKALIERLDAILAKDRESEITVAPMGDLSARLEALLRRYLAEASRCQGITAAVDRLGEQYRRDIDQLVSEYGQSAINAALNKMPVVSWPSVALH
jgi:hypothetical protein